MIYRLKPMLEMASRIHSAKGGVRASQALDDEAADLTEAACVSDAILASISLYEGGKNEQRKEVEIFRICLVLAMGRDSAYLICIFRLLVARKLRILRKYLAISCYQ